METFLIVLFVFLFLILIMSVGVLMGREPIAGSCGGMGALGMDVACDICKGDKSICDELSREEDEDLTQTPRIYNPKA